MNSNMPFQLGCDELDCELGVRFIILCKRKLDWYCQTVKYLHFLIWCYSSCEGDIFLVHFLRTSSNACVGMRISQISLGYTRVFFRERGNIFFDVSRFRSKKLVFF